jgi:hypothetical protein
MDICRGTSEARIRVQLGILAYEYFKAKYEGKVDAAANISRMGVQG